MERLPSLIDRLPSGAVTTHPGELAAHAHDLSAVALLRDGRGDRVPPPMAVAFPASTEDVAAILSWAVETGTPIVPRGGGSGIGGGAEAVRRSVVLDLTHMDRVLALDTISQTVHVQAGIRGADLEASLARQDLTTGHYVESFEMATVGGLIASASAGYASAGYGSIEDLVLGLTAVLPGGEVVELRPVPRSGAGPDLRRLLVGSEGRLGVMTEVTLSLSRIPPSIIWNTYSLHSFQAGVSFAREIIQRGVSALIVRLMDEAESTMLYSAFGHRGGAVLIVGFAGGSPGLPGRRAEVERLAKGMGARSLDEEFSAHWWDHRHDSVSTYLGVMGEERAFGPGVIVDTIGVAGLWRGLPRLYDDVRGALLSHADSVGCNLSNPYLSGASLRFAFLLRGDDDREVERAHREALAEVASSTLKANGTLMHNGDVGVVLAPFLADELGEAGVGALRRIQSALDPSGVMNPGKLLPPPGR